MQPRITKWGNSLGIRIPRPLAERLGLTEGIPVEIQAEGDTIFIRRKKYDLETLLTQVTPQNKHGEISTGNPVGREPW